MRNKHDLKILIAVLLALLFTSIVFPTDQNIMKAGLMLGPLFFFGILLIKTFALFIIFYPLVIGLFFLHKNFFEEKIKFRN